MAVPDPHKALRRADVGIREADFIRFGRGISSAQGYGQQRPEFWWASTVIST